MLRKLVCAMFVMMVAIGLVAAEEFTASITKVEGDKITYQKFKKGEKGKQGEKDGDPVTIAVAKDAKITKGKASFKDMKFAIETGDPLEGGLKNEVFTKIDEKNRVFARITTSEDKKTVTGIAVVQFGKKKDVKKTDK